MDDRTLKWLFDIKMAIDEINGFFDSDEKNFFEYRKNVMRKRAVERNLEIIGEAVNRIFKNNENLAQEISGYQSIVGLRNHIIHSYDSISDESIWSILINHLPILESEVQFLINQNSK